MEISMKESGKIIAKKGQVASQDLKGIPSLENFHATRKNKARTLIVMVVCTSGPGRMI
jgi:hypothetical protein